MVRRYRRRPIINRDKYSIEQTLICTPACSEWPTVAADPDRGVQASKQYTESIVPSVDTGGMRKVKHLTFSICNNNAQGSGDLGTVLFLL